MGIGVNINPMETCTIIPECRTMEEIKQAFLDDDHIGAL